MTCDQRNPGGVLSGHGGADFFLVNDFIKAVASGEKRSGKLSSVHDSLRSHKLVFAAERSRKKGTIEEVNV